MSMVHWPEETEKETLQHILHTPKRFVLLLVGKTHLPEPIPMKLTMEQTIKTVETTHTKSQLMKKTHLFMLQTTIMASILNIQQRFLKDLSCLQMLKTISLKSIFSIKRTLLVKQTNQVLKLKLQNARATALKAKQLFLKQ